MSDDADESAISHTANDQDPARRIAARTINDLSRRTDPAPPADTTDDPAGPASWTYLDPSSPSVSPYAGPWIHVDRLKLAELHVDDEASPADQLNVLVVGGLPEQALVLASQLAGVGDVRQISMSASAGDLAAVSTALTAGDVLVIDSLETQPTDTIEVLLGLMPVRPKPETSGSRALERSLEVQIRQDSTTRLLTLSIAPFRMLVRTWSGRVPEMLRAWDARVSFSKETRLCPDCAEEVQGAARVCRYCGFRLGDAP